MVDTEPNGPGISADEALQRLIDGNERFLRGETALSQVSEGYSHESCQGAEAVCNDSWMQ